MRALLAAVVLVVAGWSGSGLAQSYAETEVTIVSSKANMEALEKKEFEYRRGIKFWSAVADDAGLSYRVSGDYEMETEPRRKTVYVFHMIERLTEAQRANLLKLQEQGASMILVGLTGRYDEWGSEVPSLAAKWMELEGAAEYKPTEFAYFVMRGGTLLASQSPPGLRFEYEWGESATIAKTRWAQAYNVNWLLQPFPNPSDYESNTILAARVLGRSRIVWFGTAPDGLGLSRPEQAQDAKKLAATALLWAARRPVTAACHWEGCRQAAGVVTADVEDQYGNGDAIALICHKEKVKGSFFLVSGDLATEHPDTVAALAENGEIGSHTNKHEAVKGLSIEDQTGQLQSSVKALTDLGVRAVDGFRPPMEEFDENTLKAVAAAGMRFIYADVDFDRIYPVSHKVNGATIYQFARVVDDDYNIMTRLTNPDKSQYRAEFEKDLVRMKLLGGHFLFSFHTNHLAKPENVDVVRSVIRLMKEEKFWITTFGRIVDWMEVRARVEVRSRMDGPTVSIKVHNGSSVDVRKFPVHYFPPSDVTTARFVATPESGVRIKKAPVSGLVILVDLKPGEEKEILVQ